uniref:Capsid protein n=1 Tax=Dromedary picobirnavirus TaxID=1574421 RepID=A0A0A1EIS7_9VIRU|nr:capsid protein [Dromedary picobirnavirus]
MAKSQKRNNKGKEEYKGTSSKGKSKRVNNRTSKYDSETREKLTGNDHANNDIGWYVQSEEYLKDVASFPFSNALVGNAKLGEWRNILRPRDGGYSSIPQEYAMSLSGICDIRITPTYGVAFTATDPCTVAARSVYSFIRHANSGSANYDAPDLMMYLMAMDSMYMLWSWCARAYGVISTYNYNNRFYPNAILTAMGFDVTDLVTNRASFKTFIDTMSVRLSSLAVPTVFPVYQRHMWMFQNLFLDRDSGKAQTYVFNPYAIHKLIINSEEPTHLDTKLLGSGYTIKDLWELFEELSEPLFSSEDIGIMSGDILKAYGSSGIFRINPIPDNYAIIPIYQEDILPQIHNINFIPRFTTSGYTQTLDGVIVAEYDYSRVSDAYNSYFWSVRDDGDYLLDMPYNNPSPSDVMYATRLTPSFALADTGSSNNMPVIDVNAVGTELVSRMDIYAFSDDDNSIEKYEFFNGYSLPYMRTTAQKWDVPNFGTDLSFLSCSSHIR